MHRKLISLALLALVLSPAHYVAAQMNTRKPTNILSLGPAGVATPEPGTLSVAASLVNLTNRAVTEVKIEHIEFATARVQTPLPMTIGEVGARSSVIVQAELDSQTFVSGQRYEFLVQGTYREGVYRGDRGAARRFRVRTFVVIPPPSEGSGRLRTTQVPSQKVEGGRYPPRPPRMDKDVNSGAPPVPTNPEVPGAPTPTVTEPKPQPK